MTYYFTSSILSRIKSLSSYLTKVLTNADQTQSSLDYSFWLHFFPLLSLSHTVQLVTFKCKKKHQPFCLKYPFLRHYHGLLFLLKSQQLMEFPDGLAIKDLELSLLRLRFNPWLRKFHMLWVKPKKKKSTAQKFAPITQSNTEAPAHHTHSAYSTLFFLTTLISYLVWLIVLLCNIY